MINDKLIFQKTAEKTNKGTKEKTKGLTEKEVQEILKRDGYNELPTDRRSGFWAVLGEVMREPMLFLLAAAAGIYFFLGEPADAILLSLFVVFVLGVTFYQRRKTEKALEALKNLSSPRALVLRGGIRRRVPGREVAVGDVIFLREGDRVPADAMLSEAVNLTVDESLLTGESLAVFKSVDGKRKEERTVYSGTLIARGHGLARVFSTGANAEIGKIGKSLQSINEEKPLLKREIVRLTRIFAFVGLTLCFAAVFFYGLTGRGWLDGILYGLTIGMSLLPEEFPVVMVVFLALGAWRISKREVLTRNTAAIESLGAAQVLCVDKTGTITLNRMRLQTLSANGQIADLDDYENKGKNLPADFHSLLEYAILAGQTDPFDPMEKEIRRTGEFFLAAGRLHTDWKLIKEYPFSGNILALSHVWEAGDGDSYIVAAKGAPESVAELCRFSVGQNQALAEQMRPLLDRGLRLLGVAFANVAKGDLPKRQHEFEFRFAGLLGFEDPIRPSASDAIKDCYRAGIRICMITGDYPATACAAARRVGLKNPEAFLTGDDLRLEDENELRRKIGTVNVFARVAPEQKMIIIRTLKKQNKVIAMTGDGVNDAPALKAAHIGIAMGGRGTDVAREAADLVLINDDFSSIAAAVRTGRAIFDNLKKALAYIFAVHIPIAGMSFLPVALGMPVVFFPAHIAFLELIIDPACSLVFENEPESGDIMSRPPRKLNEPLFNRKTALISFLQGLGVLTAVFLLFQFLLDGGRTGDEARAITFCAVVFANVMLIISNLSWSEPGWRVLANGNKALCWMLVSVPTILVLTLSAPVLRQVFHFAAIDLKDIALAFVVAGVSLLWFEIFKLFSKNQSV